MNRSLVLRALDMALGNRSPARGLIHHSDRGSQYASEDYRQTLTAAGITASMSHRGNCYDNAVIESFWHSLKNELVHRQHFATRAEATAAIFDDIEVFYNQRRPHQGIGNRMIDPDPAPPTPANASNGSPPWPEYDPPPVSWTPR